MAEPPWHASELFHGLPSRILTLANGDRLQVLLHGAQLVSWVAGGRERLYLSPRSRFDGRSAIRGGVPVCFPQFNQRGSLPKHGFARNLAWESGTPPTVSGEGVRLTLHLRSGAATQAFWAQAFEAELALDLRPGSLQISLDVRNADETPLCFTGALHTYLAVDDIAGVELSGLAGQAEWDAVTGRRVIAGDPLRFAGEFDRVYTAASRFLALRDGSHGLTIAQSASWAETVVWNPGADKGAALPDLPPDGYARLLCVEAAQVSQAITLAPGARWQGWQRLSVA